MKIVKSTVENNITTKLINQSNMKKHFYKLPFKFKLWWAKQFLYMFKGFGSIFNDDIILYNELKLWVETKGKPTSKNL
jgi:hypothetical protein